MKARPRQLPFLHREVTEAGKLRITVRLRRARWVKWLGGSGEFERTYSLDKFGQEVYEACDGKTTVLKIVKRFANRHRISMPEAEASVTEFLKTMLSKGLIGMEVDKDSL